MGWGIDTSYGAYHFASRVLPLWFISQVDWVIDSIRERQTAGFESG